MKNIILLFAVLSMISCKKTEQNNPENERKITAECDGTNQKVLVNGSLFGVQPPFVEVSVKLRDIVRIKTDTIHYGSTVVPCRIKFEIYNGNGKLLNQKITESNLSQDISYTIN